MESKIGWYSDWGGLTDQSQEPSRLIPCFPCKPYLINLWKLLLYLNSDHVENAVVLFIVTYCFWATLWKFSSSIIWVTLIIENLVIFCLHSVIGDYILLCVPSDWWILDIPLSWFQFCFLVDVIIFISNFSGLVSCLLLIFYVKRIHILHRTWCVQRLNQLFLVAPTG